LPIFISYSPADKKFVNKLVEQFGKRHAHVRVDLWELNVGDSILGRAQEAIRESSALLIVLSKASVESEWCKKELSAGLMHKLDAKGVVVLPVLIEECHIPVFLRGKKYADFRTDFGTGLKALLEAVSRVTNTDQGRLTSGERHIDWAETWGYTDELFRMDYALVESSPDCRFTLLTEISLICDAAATSKYQAYEKVGLDWVERMVITETLVEFVAVKDMRVILEDQFPKMINYRLGNRRLDNVSFFVPPRKSTGLVWSTGGMPRAYDVSIRCRRIGEDNGKNQIVNIASYLGQIRDHVQKTARKLTPEKLARIMEIQSRQ
jgi:hypothetical protein